MLRTLLLVFTLFGTALSAQTVVDVDSPDNLNSPEETVQQIIEQDGIHVVRFWNHCLPRCLN